jgi:hypothetical protein
MQLHIYKNAPNNKPPRREDIPHLQFIPPRRPILPNPIRRRDSQPLGIQPQRLRIEDLSCAFGEDDVSPADEFDAVPDEG